MLANFFGPDLGIVVVVILVVVLGGSQLPKIARNVGMAGKEFRKGQEAEMNASPELPSSAQSSSDATQPPARQSLPSDDTDGSVQLTRAQLDTLLRGR